MAGNIVPAGTKALIQTWKPPPSQDSCWGPRSGMVRLTLAWLLRVRLSTMSSLSPVQGCPRFRYAREICPPCAKLSLGRPLRRPIGDELGGSERARARTRPRSWWQQQGGPAIEGGGWAPRRSLTSACPLTILQIHNRDLALPNCRDALADEAPLSLDCCYAHAPPGTVSGPVPSRSSGRDVTCSTNGRLRQGGDCRR